jgi:TM2 domain-containing membrane protein YozV
MNEEKITKQAEAERSPFNWTAVFFISLFLGFFGVDRFYIGKKISGVIKLLTLGGSGIWWLVDLFIIASGKSTDASKRKIRNTSKQRILAFVLIPLAIGVVVGICSSPEERERGKAEREQRTAEREQRKQTELELKKVEQEQKKIEREQKKAERESKKPKSKEQEYEETYGKTIYDATPFYKMFRDKPLAVNKLYENGPLPIQIYGEILDMGSNSYGNYIDLYTHYEKSEKIGNIRVFLADSEWNNNAIQKIKRRNMIGLGGLCYGQTEIYGIKTKIIIGNATILKINGKFL